MKKIDSYFNPLIVAKTIFHHASVFSESKNENERIYAQKLKAFINLAADELQVTDKDTDFSDRLYLRIMDLQIETFNKNGLPRLY